MQQPPGSPPPFAILSPSPNDYVIPNFSVWGSCGAIVNPTTPVVNVHYGSNDPVTAKLNVSGKSWEAILDGVTGGAQVIKASCSTGASQQVTVIVSTSPPYTVDEPTPPPPTPPSAPPGGNPWAGWTVGGTCDPSVVSKIDLYITKKGQQLPPANPATATVTIQPGQTNWSLNLDSFPIAAYVGKGFCVHTVATMKSGVIVRGSIPSFFNVPPNSDAD